MLPTHNRNYSAGQAQALGTSYSGYQQSPQYGNQGQAANDQAFKQDYTGDGDIAMEDADPYNRMKYPSRPAHARNPSASLLSGEDSSAARRYSPMNTSTLTPSSPYAATPQTSSYGAYSPSGSARQSPSRAPKGFSSPSQPYPQNCMSPGSRTDLEGKRS